jgi:hypothetical protein
MNTCMRIRQLPGLKSPGSEQTRRTHLRYRLSVLTTCRRYRITRTSHEAFCCSPRHISVGAYSVDANVDDDRCCSLLAVGELLLVFFVLFLVFDLIVPPPKSDFYTRAPQLRRKWTPNRTTVFGLPSKEHQHMRDASLDYSHHRTYCR